MRVKKVLVAMLGMCRKTVVCCWELHDGDRPRLEVGLRTRVPVGTAATSSTFNVTE